MAKRAIIFVHGIGEQQRYLMRDGLANAIVAADIGATRGEIVPIPIPVEGAGPQKSVVGRMVTRGVQRADIFEVYWAPRLSGKTKTPSVLRWILGATFLPATALRRPSGKTLMDILQVLLYSVIGLFAALMTLNVLGNLTAFADCATRPEKIQEAEETKECDPQIAADSYISVPDESRNLGTASATLVRQVRRALALSDRPLSDLTPEHAGEVLRRVSILNWLGLMVFGWLGAQVLFRLRHMATGQRLVEQTLALGVITALFLVLFSLLSPTLTALVLTLLVVTAVVKVGSRFLAESLGDVQVYSERDENSDLFAAREAVIKDYEEVVAAIHGASYDEVVIVAHSLGAVITFDILTDANLPDGFRGNVRALVTIGSALEKVRYFFDKRSPDIAERQVLVGKALNRAGYDRLWVNVWYLLDWVANPIRASVGTQPVSGYAWPADQNPFPWIEQGRDNLVVNLRPTNRVRPFPPSHSAYLADLQVQRLVATLSLAPNLADVGNEPWPAMHTRHRSAAVSTEQ